MVNAGIQLISPSEFVQGMRHGGYKSLASAISELVDNSIEAKATVIKISLDNDVDKCRRVSVLDNGIGMTPTVLSRCLQFGGTSRFDSRAGLGRFGLGLPASSLSFSKKVICYSWRSKYRVYNCHLDIDEIIDGTYDISPPKKCSYPGGVSPSNTGTLVVWENCDRIEFRRLRYLLGRIHAELGRRFRRFLADGITILVNNVPVPAIDPLLLTPDEFGRCAKLYGHEVGLAIRVNSESTMPTSGKVSIRFVELPVRDWYSLSVVDKRRKGITRASGISILRAGREIDYGWFFVGSKRRENYDDWWRCEVEFDPVLDEEFGLSHTKQQIRPSDNLTEILTPIIEPIARSLSTRVREAHDDMAVRVGSENPVIAVAQRLDNLLEDLAENEVAYSKSPSVNINRYRDSTSEFYKPIKHSNGVELTLNESHVFSQWMEKTPGNDCKYSRQIKEKIETLLLAAGRAELTFDGPQREILQRFRSIWGKILSCYINN